MLLPLPQRPCSWRRNTAHLGDILTYFSSSLRGFAVLLLIASPALVHAAVRSVPSAAYPTIQSAVDAAVDSDTVLVADGTYAGPGNRDIDFHGKNLTVTSAHGPAKTIVDCGGYKSKDGSGNHRGFYLHSGEKKATISGFTIKNGCEITASANQISLGVFRASPGFAQGGGVEFSDFLSGDTFGTLSLSDCIISKNTATYGGGVYNNNEWHEKGFGKHGGTITLTHCVVSGNTALFDKGDNESEGGGIYNRNANGGKIMLLDCTISENLATAPSASVSTGGGVCNYNFNDQTSGDKNVAEGGTITLTNCTISKNHVFGESGGGGGIENVNLVAVGKIALTNCAIFGNTADGYGGGIYNGSATGGNGGIVTIAHCTVSHNAALRGGGGMYDSYFLHMGSVFTLTDCIFFGDKGGEIANDYTQTVGDLKFVHALGGKLKSAPVVPMKISVTFSDIQGGFAGAGNINADPLFADASAGDFHLKSGSPCLNIRTWMGAYGVTKP